MTWHCFHKTEVVSSLSCQYCLIFPPIESFILSLVILLGAKSKTSSFLVNVRNVPARVICCPLQKLVFWLGSQVCKVYVPLKKRMCSSVLRKLQRLTHHLLKMYLGIVYPEVLMTLSSTKPPTDICLVSHLFWE